MIKIRDIFNRAKTDTVQEDKSYLHRYVTDLGFTDGEMTGENNILKSHTYCFALLRSECNFRLEREPFVYAVGSNQTICDIQQWDVLIVNAILQSYPRKNFNIKRFFARHKKEVYGKNSPRDYDEFIRLYEDEWLGVKIDRFIDNWCKCIKKDTEYIASIDDRLE